MSPEHREIRESLGSWAMGHLDPEERELVDLHLEGCAECRNEAESLKRTGAMLALADPAVIGSLSEPLPRPSPGFDERVMAELHDPGPDEARRDRRRWWMAVPAIGAVTAPAVALILAFGGGGHSGSDAGVRTFAFSSLPPGVSIDGAVEPKATGTGIEVNVNGMRPGTLCRVYVRTASGKLEPAGTFRYRYSAEEHESYPATLSTAWDLSEINQLVIKAGDRIFETDV